MKKSMLVKLFLVLIFIVLIVVIFSFFNNKKYKTGLVCIRAKELHTEVCDQMEDWEYCTDAGYSSGDIITYGNLGTKGVLSSGDAFDCDVNGDGKYDSKTERFYYVTDLESNNDYAVLIYYTNVIDGNPNNTIGAEYDLSGVNNNGPVTAITNLPTIDEWKNVRLYENTRKITTHDGNNSTDSGLLPTDFSYSGYAARLLTVQEIVSACNVKDLLVNSELDNCTYLLENTAFSSNLIDLDGLWLENAFEYFPDHAFQIYSGHRNINYAEVNEKVNGVRPVIEVKKTDIA